MRQLSRFLAIGMLAGVLAPAFAQNIPAPEKVHFESADGVQLQGTFYAAAPNKNIPSPPPAVLMLHALGENSQGWTQLAKELQKRGFAILTFDFRGHGLSTELHDKELFWRGVGANRVDIRNAILAANPRLAAAKKPQALGKESIDYANFHPTYYQYLVNDIAAARAFLDRKNDAGACNTSNLILIGADTGATLGAIWLQAEYYKVRLKPKFAGGPLVPETRGEGHDIIGCVWLGIRDKLGDAKLNLATSTLYLAGKVKAVPMSFWYGAKDKKGEKEATKLVDSLAKGKDKKREEKYKLTTAVEVTGSALSGSKLLQKDLNTAKNIGFYLEEGVIPEKNTEWVARESLKTAYGWRNFNGAYVGPANKMGEKTLYFKDYNAYR